MATKTTKIKVLDKKTSYKEEIKTLTKGRNETPTMGERNFHTKGIKEATKRKRKSPYIQLLRDKKLDLNSLREK